MPRCRAAGRGVRVMYPLPCGGIFFYAPSLRHNFLVSAGLVALFIVGPSFFMQMGQSLCIGVNNYSYRIATQVYSPVS